MWTLPLKVTAAPAQDVVGVEMSGTSPGNPLTINCWKCMFDSILSASSLKAGKETIHACFLHPRSRVGRGGWGWEAQAGWYLPTGMISRPSVHCWRPDMASLRASLTSLNKEQRLLRSEEGACESRSPSVAPIRVRTEGKAKGREGARILKGKQLG